MLRSSSSDMRQLVLSSYGVISVNCASVHPSPCECPILEGLLQFRDGEPGIRFGIDADFQNVGGSYLALLSTSFWGVRCPTCIPVDDSAQLTYAYLTQPCVGTIRNTWLDISGLVGLCHNKYRKIFLLISFQRYPPTPDRSRSRY